MLPGYTVWEAGWIRELGYNKTQLTKSQGNN